MNSLNTSLFISGDLIVNIETFTKFVNSILDKYGIHGPYNIKIVARAGELAKLSAIYLKIREDQYLTSKSQRIIKDPTFTLNKKSWDHFLRNCNARSSKRLPVSQINEKSVQEFAPELAS